MKKNRLMRTSAMAVGLMAIMGLAGCEVVLLENPTTRELRDARVAARSVDGAAAAENMLRTVLINARDEQTRNTAAYELGRLLMDSPNADTQAEGLSLIQQAAISYPAAQRRLGNMFAEGDGVQQNTAQASRFLRAAIAGGNTGAQIDLAKLIRADGSAGTAAEAAELARTGIVALDRESREGNANASRQLGEIYDEGVIVAANRAQAEAYYSRAIEQGQANAVPQLAELWINGSQQDQQRAIRLLEMGADRNVAAAVRLLGDQYRAGTITERDRDLALAYYLRGATDFEGPTVRRIAGTLREGSVSAERRAEAIQYLEQAANAGSVDAAMELGKIAEAAGRNAAAARYFRIGANAGIADAKYRLGKMLFDGNGVRRNYGEAVPLLRAAAAAGISGTAGRLGQAYAEGLGVRQDWRQARRYLTAAANEGSISAANLLVQAYTEGLGGAADPEQAFRWTRFAANRGSVSAAARLSEMHRDGIGTEVNPGEALRWAERAGQGGSERSLLDTGWAYAAGQGVPQDPQRAQEFFERAVEIDPSNAGTIARAYADGSRGVQDPERAAYWSEIAAQAGDPQALRQQAQQVENTDADLAAQTYRQAAANGDPVAIVWLADQEFARNNFDAGFALLVRAAAAGSSNAALRLGRMSAFGDGVPQDFGKAFEYYMRGAELGNTEAMFWVGMAYRQGLGVAQDEAKAQEWLDRARDAGYQSGN